ncbi:MAG: threonine--tRNA ligase, partial [Ignavibacteria bacterium]
LAIKINGKIKELYTPINQDAEIKILTFDDDEGKEVYWHSSSHLMAHAIEKLFPGAKFGVGPAIENGFYYDVDVDRKITPEDLIEIEKKMAELAKEAKPFVRKECSIDEAIDFFSQKGDEYKLELLKDIDSREEQVSMYEEGDFVDLCRGPHLPDAGKIKYFKLLSVAGSFWKGDPNNKPMQRVYGISFPKKKLLDEYLTQLEEAKKRDHRKLGKELELFFFNEIAPAAPFWLPKGMIIFRELEKFLRETLDKQGYQEISTPILVKKTLWERSGHWDHYKENMFILEVDNEIYSLKPMNCPESTIIYKSKLRSYRDLPLRLSEIGRLHRNEISGALGGMLRVRQITMDDAHLFVRPDQILEEITKLLKLINDFYTLFGFSPSFNLSTRPEKAMGDLSLWDQAEEALKQALELNNINYKIKEGEGAFYGPKIDVQIKDAIGRSWQTATIQLDFQMPERFELEYIDENDERKRPVMIHRAIFGSFERFIGILTEHFAGYFPTWLSPVQVVVLPISDNFLEYAQKVYQVLFDNNIRVELDKRNEKIGYKIREWENQKVPYMLIVGEKETQNNSVSVRKHKKGDLGSFDLNQFLQLILDEIKTKKLHN